jgi:hypothetical protein
VEDVELSGGVSESRLLVIGDGQIEAEGGIGFMAREGGQVLFDGFIEVALPGEDDSQVGARFHRRRGAA